MVNALRCELLGLLEAIGVGGRREAIESIVEAYIPGGETFQHNVVWELLFKGSLDILLVLKDVV